MELNNAPVTTFKSERTKKVEQIEIQWSFKIINYT